MKFTAKSTELQHTLSKLSGVIPSKSTMPILENVLFELLNDNLTLTATDMAVSLTVTLKVQGGEDGRIAVPSKRLMDTMRSLPPDTDTSFVIDTTTQKIKITTPNGEYNLTGENARDFPVVPPFEGKDEISIDSGTLKRIIYKTAFAVSADELRPAMMGVLFQTKENELRAVSTDGHRLVRLIHKPEKPVRLQRDIIIPAKALQAINRSLDEGTVTISISDTHVKFALGGTVLVSRLIEEAYPKYESVIPLDNTKTMTTAREELISSIRRVALYASSTTHQIRFDIRNNELHITAQDLDFGGEAKEKVGCTFSDEPMEIGFNASYMVDILSHLDSENVVFKFSTPTRAGIVSPVEQNGHDDVMMLVMPVRLNS